MATFKLISSTFKSSVSATQMVGSRHETCQSFIIQRLVPTMPTLYFNSSRFAGHAKWQNISHTKAANDKQKSRVCGRYVQLVRKAITSNNMITDPKLNRALANTLADAMKLNVPKATLDRAIERTKNLKIFSFNIEIEGPGKSSVIVKCESDNVGLTRKDVKKIIKKFSNSCLMTEDSIINMFKNQGVVRATLKTTDGREIDMDLAEEAAINANAEEVSVETFDDTADEELAKTLVFITHPDIVNQCKGELEKQKFKILSCETELVPYNKVDFGEEVAEQVDEMIKALRELPEIVDIYTNLA